MATPRIVSVRDFTTSRFAQLADTSSANIGDVLVRAEQAIERRIKRPIYPTEFTQFISPSKNTIYLQYRPVIEVSSLYRGFTSPTAIVDPSLYRVDPVQGIIYSKASLIGQNVSVTYIAGYEETPQDLIEAVLIQATMFLFQDFEVYGSGDSKKPGILYFYEDIDRLLEPYKQLNTAYNP